MTIKNNIKPNKEEKMREELKDLRDYLEENVEKDTPKDALWESAKELLDEFNILSNEAVEDVEDIILAIDEILEEGK